MLLAIDAGNSAVDFGFYQKDRLLNVFRMSSLAGRTSDEYLAFLYAHMHRVRIEEEIGEVIISCVVPALVRTLFEAAGAISGRTPLLLSTRLRLPVQIRYKTPDTLGTDRIAAASAAYSLFGGPVVVIDFGSATTFSVVDGGGGFLGGLIAPGLVTGYDALIDKAQGIAKGGLTFPRAAVGTSTAECVQSGVIFGHAAMAAGLLGRVESELGVRPTAVATGGLADMVTPHMGVEVKLERSLTLNGLRIIHQLNT